MYVIPEERVAHPLAQQALPERSARLVQGREEVEAGAAASEPGFGHLRIWSGDLPGLLTIVDLVDYSSP